MAAIFSTVEKINVLPIRIKCRIISASFNSRNCFCFKQFSKLAMYWWFGFPEVLKTQITRFFFKKMFKRTCFDYSELVQILVIYISLNRWVLKLQHNLWRNIFKEYKLFSRKIRILLWFYKKNIAHISLCINATMRFIDLLVAK